MTLRSIASVNQLPELSKREIYRRALHRGHDVHVPRG